MLNSKDKFFQSTGPYLFLLFVATVLLWPIIAKHSTFLLTYENRHMGYAYLVKLNSSLHHGYFPIWDANAYGGRNFPGEFQPGIFYPFNILLCLLFGTADGINPYYLDLLIVLHYFIAMFGMYAVSRLFKLPPVASVTCALIYAFTGGLAVRPNAEANMFYGVCLLPWVIYFTSKYYVSGRKRKYLIFSGLMGGMQILDGHIQPYFHAMMIAGIIIIFFEYHNRKSWISFIGLMTVNFLLVVAAAIVIALPQIYYSFQYLSISYRWIGAPDGFPIAPGQKVPYHIFAYLYMLNPSDYSNLLGKNITRPTDNDSIYMGILPLFLLITYLIKSRYIAIQREHKDLTKLIVIIAVVGIASSLGYLTFLSAILWSIPLVDTVRELARYSTLLNFSFAILAGLALANIAELGRALFQNSPKAKYHILLALTANALYLLIFQRKMIDPGISVPFLGTFLFFLLLKTSPKNVVVYAAFLGVLFLDLFLNKVDYWPIDSRYPSTFFQRDQIITFLEKSYGKYRVSYEVQGYETGKPNIGDIYNIQTRFGYCATMNVNYFNYINENETSWDPHSETYDLLNIRYLVTEKLLDSSFIFLDSLPKTYLYERKNYYPRIYWKSQIGMPGKEIENENADKIHQLAYADMYQKVKVICLTPDTLIFSENYYPGWKCYDNGKQIPISMPTIKNHPPLFRAIALDKGEHMIEFKYATLFNWSENK